MNIIRNTLIASILALVTLAASAQETPAIQAPTPQVDVQWALAAVELPAPTDVPSENQALLLEASCTGNTWQFRELINGHETEITVTELIATDAPQIAYLPTPALEELAGI